MRQILVVDSSPLCRELVARTLEAEGFSVVCAPTCRDATRVLSSSKPDLLLLEPTTDGEGMRLLEMLRQSTRLRPMPVIILTDLLDKGLVVRAAQLGVRD